jgi:hypothetical protein
MPFERNTRHFLLRKAPKGRRQEEMPCEAKDFFMVFLLSQPVPSKKKAEPSSPALL